MFILKVAPKLLVRLLSHGKQPGLLLGTGCIVLRSSLAPDDRSAVRASAGVSLGVERLKRSGQFAECLPTPE